MCKSDLGEEFPILIMLEGLFDQRFEEEFFFETDPHPYPYTAPEEQAGPL
jgi:hypothetical protein